MAERSSQPIEITIEKDHFGHFGHPLSDLLGPAPEQRARHVAAARQRQLEVLEHGEILIDRRRLELAADAETDDLLLAILGDLLILELDRAFRDARAPADQ